MATMNRLLLQIKNLLQPQQCAVCGCRLSHREQVCCSVCNVHLPRTHFAREPYTNRMARLLWGRIPIEKIAAFYYHYPKSASASIIYDMKYYNNPTLGYRIARMLVAEPDFQHFFDGIDCMVPIPLSASRQRMRGYNQCQYLVEGLREATGIPIVKNAVRRTLFIESQTKKDFRKRNDNVEGVFELNCGDGIRNKHVLLVDDVMTTGATVCSCAKELLKVEGVKLSVLTLAYSKQQLPR